MAEDWKAAGFGLYLHWPFCAAKCPYCDFNSHVRREIDEARWVRAYVSELNRVAARVPNRVLSTVFFGGGTPSLMSPESVATVIEHIRHLWPMTNDPEITLEANPGSVEAAKFRGFRDAGVTRVSLGVQALNDRDLRRLGRVHTADDALQALDIAQNCFDSVSFDLIYARQDQTLDAWRAELELALSRHVDHLSLYQLTIEDGTVFADRRRAGGLRGLPCDDHAADLYEMTQEICAGAGLPGYEVSNHARPGHECQHNLIYWRCGDYAGIGPGAHGRLSFKGGRYATETLRNPEGWLRGIETATGAERIAALSNAEQAKEYLLMGLRLHEGIDLERYRALAGQSIRAAAVDELSALGLLTGRGSRLWPTCRGFLLLNAIVETLAED